MDSRPVARDFIVKMQEWRRNWNPRQQPSKYRQTKHSRN